MSVINFSSASCKNCYACVKACPIQAIKIKDEQAIIMEERCIACGLCLKACPKNVKKIETELEKVQSYLKRGEKVAVSLAPTCFGVFDFSAQILCGILKKLGFYYVEETAVGALSVTKAYQSTQDEMQNCCFITSCCASVNLLVEKHFPKLIPTLIPVMTPLMVHARLLKQKYGHETKVVFIGPCLAKKIEGEEDLFIDAVLTIEELMQWLEQEKIDFEKVEPVLLDATEQSQRTYPIVGGMSDCFTNKNEAIEIIAVDGINDCIEVLEGLERGDFNNCFFEMSACHHSCIGGPAIGDKEVNLFKRKMRIKKYKEQKEINETPASQVYPVEVNLQRTFKNKYFPILQPDEKEIEEILHRIGKYSVADELNCGSCGYKTCRQKAIAVYNQFAEPSMCLPYMKHKAETYSHVIFDVTPSIILVVNEALTMVDINPAAEKFFDVTKDQAVGLPISIFLDESPFLTVLNNQEDLIGHRLSLNHNQTTVIESIIRVEHQDVMLCILHDLTEEIRHEQQIQRLKIDAVEMAQQVINKQMIVAQEIASLLGETTAETKVTLTRLKQLIQENEV